MPYIANTPIDRQVMLEAIGVHNIDSLWKAAGIHSEPPNLHRIPEGLSELEVIQLLQELAGKNRHDLTCFIGAGFYDHFIPAVVPEIIGRSEFYTSYTPYQPEASQGTLQAMYEYQSMICRLCDREVSNASLYDGGTAAFEAILMALRLTGRRKAIIAGTLSPIYQEMIRCYSQNLDMQLVISPVGANSTLSNFAEIERLLDTDTACIVGQYPNFFGTLEDWSGLISKAKEKKIISICSTYPIALSLARSPGNMGFDIVSGEGQSLGIPLSFGGPYLGFIASRMKYVRQLPGRIVGRTVDKNGKSGFVLTLQAREQHIRREKATSNICTNEGLCALAAVVYMSCIGKNGFSHLGKLCSSKAYYAREQLLKINGINAPEQPSFFNEFVIRLPISAAIVIDHLIDKGFVAGFPLDQYYDRSNHLLIAVTEKRSQRDIDQFVAAIADTLARLYPEKNQ